MREDVILYDEQIAQSCVYGAEFVKEILFSEQHNSIYIPSKQGSLSSRKLEGFCRLAQYRAYYQQNPVRFIRDFFNIQLLDSQAYLMMEAWNKQQVMILGSRAYGKSFWSVLFCMAKQMLNSFPWNCYIASGSAEQSATTFKKLEDIANDRVESLVNSSGSVFKAEVEINNAVGDGFSHGSTGFTYSLYNGSFTKSVNSNVSRNRGKRAACVIFDETSFLDADLIQVYQAFCAVDKDFKTGVTDTGEDFDAVTLHTLPKELPTQLIYVSSASSTDTEFYRMYREFSKRMLMGDPNYFVADIDCELVMKPTIGGNKIKPALTREKIEAQMATNPEKARREYFNCFSEDAGANAIIRRGTIARNEEIRKPILYNDTGDRKIVIAYDPARSRDNSVILVCEIYEFKDSDGSLEYKMRILNCINLIDVAKKRRTPMRTPEQVEYLKELILDYNQGGDETYSNILGIYIDAGSGGGGVNIADYLMEDWKGKDGRMHRGLIDKVYSEEYVKKFPNAVDKIHLMSPTQFKSQMYEAMIELMDQDKINFTASYDGKGYLTVFDADQNKLNKVKDELTEKLKKKKMPAEQIQQKIDEELSKIQNVKTRVEKLNWQEEIALFSIDVLKEELVNMVRIKRESGKDSFEICPEKKNKMHDDRAYCMALCSYALQQERRKNITKKKRYSGKESLVASLPMRRGKRIQSLFAG